MNFVPLQQIKYIFANKSLPKRTLKDLLPNVSLKFKLQNYSTFRKTNQNKNRKMKESHKKPLNLQVHTRKIYA